MRLVRNEQIFWSRRKNIYAKYIFSQITSQSASIAICQSSDSISWSCAISWAKLRGNQMKVPEIIISHCRSNRVGVYHQPSKQMVLHFPPCNFRHHHAASLQEGQIWQLLDPHWSHILLRAAHLTESCNT